MCSTLSLQLSIIVCGTKMCAVITFHETGTCKLACSRNFTPHRITIFCSLALTVTCLSVCRLSLAFAVQNRGRRIPLQYVAALTNEDTSYYSLSIRIYLNLWCADSLKEIQDYKYSCLIVHKIAFHIVTVRLTTGIPSEKCAVRRFRRCANIIDCTYTNLDSIAHYTPRLYGIAHCC